ncbi:MAG: helix-turn-helix domain-containing protein [Candidatus Binatia bacterium]
MAKKTCISSADVGVNTFLEPVRQSSFRAKGPPATAPCTSPYWTTGEIGLVPGVSPRAIEWEQEAALATFSLAPVLLSGTGPAAPSGATGELVWVPRPEKTKSRNPAVHPSLIVRTPHEALQAERVLIVPDLKGPDPLLHHIALVLQVALAGESEAGHLYTQSLADALAVHFLRRYTAEWHPPMEVSGGLSPYKLRRTTAYIQDHLDQALSLVHLAAVAQTSPAHFARLFKQATGLAPHQYVLRCRMEHAKRLLAETDLPLGEIGLQVGCTDQSHFGALFRTHFALTPKAYRDQTKQQ